MPFWARQIGLKKSTGVSSPQLKAAWDAEQEKQEMMQIYKQICLNLSIFASSVGLFVKLDRLINYLIGPLFSLELVDFHFFVLHFLVVLKESVDLISDMLRKLGNVIIVGNWHITLRHRDDFIVSFPLVNHSHNSDWLCFQQAHRFYTHTAQNEDIKRIVVIAESLGDEAVVVRVVDCTEKHSVKFEHSTIFVQFVFDLAIGGDLNDSINYLRRFLAIGDVVPRVFSEVLFAFCFLH